MGKRRSRSSKASATVTKQQDTDLPIRQQPRKESSSALANSQRPAQQSRQSLTKKHYKQRAKGVKKGSGHQSYWYRHNRKQMAKKYPPLFIKITPEVRLLVYKHFFAGRTMIDISTTQRTDFRRKYGAQSLLLVNKQIRIEAMNVFFKTCTFQLHHFRLHHKHWRINPLRSLTDIRHLDLLWTPPPRATFTTKFTDNHESSWMKDLRELTIDLFGMQYMKIDSGDGELELHRNIMGRFEARMEDLPRWMKILLRDVPDAVKTYLRVYFFAAPVASDTFFARATILWRDKNIVKVEPYSREEWETARKVTAFGRLPPAVAGM